MGLMFEANGLSGRGEFRVVKSGPNVVGGLEMRHRCAALKTNGEQCTRRRWVEPLCWQHSGDELKEKE